jgi:hypothetical protein
VDSFKAFDVRGSFNIACCDVFNTLARRVGLSVYKDNDVFILVIFILLFLTILSLRFRRVFVPVARPGKPQA